jgi:RNA polymerase sigma-70 factor (ECF subfamily)
MMRITRIADHHAEILRVEGRLTHDSADALRVACDAAVDRGALALDVSGLQYVDATGVGLLHGLQRSGARIGGASGFLVQLLRDAEDPGGPSRPLPGADGDADLLARLRRGDADAFEALVRRYGGRMLATARRFVHSEEDARDVVQDAFLAAFRALDGFEGTALLSTWLHRIVVNTALMKLRSRRRRPEESIEELLPRFDETGHWAEPPTWAWDGGSETLVDRRRTRATVRAAIDRLPRDYRTVILLRDIEELDTEETAALLGISTNAVRTRLHRARQALRTLIGRELQ